jgi:hypothetical protein
MRRTQVQWVLFAPRINRDLVAVAIYAFAGKYFRRRPVDLELVGTTTRRGKDGESQHKGEWTPKHNSEDYTYLREYVKVALHHEVCTLNLVVLCGIACSCSVLPAVFREMNAAELGLTDFKRGCGFTCERHLYAVAANIGGCWPAPNSQLFVAKADENHGVVSVVFDKLYRGVPSWF